MKYSVMLAVMLSACAPAEEHGHAHGPDGDHAHGDDRPLQEVILRQDQLEIFVKYPALIKGELSTFETYLTKLEGYQPLDSALVTISLIRDGKGIRHQVANPNKNGVYLPALRPLQDGMHRLVLDLEHAGGEKRLELGEIKVFQDTQGMVEALGNQHHDESGIAFTKKQSWEIDFQVQPVVDTAVFDVINTSGIWRSAPGDSKTLVANASGIVNFNQNLLTEGATVKKGQPLITITSRGLTTDNLEVEIEKARADHNQIEAEYQRQKILYESNLIPRAEWERSESKYLVSKASIESLVDGYQQGGKQIKVPFDGFVQSIDVENGDYVAQGTELFTVIALKSQILETQISLSYALVPADIQDIWFRQTGGKWSSMKQSGGSVLSIGREVTEREPLLPVFARVNTKSVLPQGSYAEVRIGIGNENRKLALPESALMESYGNYSVMVQVSGETYHRRPVEIGSRNGELVEVTRGLRKGELVVTRGTYQVKMASMSASVPGHGHEH